MTRTIASVLFFVSVAFLVAGPLEARTWRITPEGTGDAPFLQAAMDSATAGDTVLVAAGVYEIGAITVTNGVVLRSEAGAFQTKLVEYPGVAGGLACGLLSARTEISGIWFDGFDGGSSEGLGAINILDCLDLQVRGCIFTNNDVAGISINSQFSTVIENNTFANNVLALSIQAGGGWCSNNILWDPIQNLGQSFVIRCNDVLNLNDLPALFRPFNFSQDPQFCRENDYRLAPGSPCGPGNSPFGGGCDLIGALPVGCSPVPVRAVTWGQMKALYRGRQ